MVAVFQVVQQFDIFFGLCNFGCFFTCRSYCCAVFVELFVRSRVCQVADGIHSGVELQESLLYVLPLGAKLIIGKARSEGVGANINGIEAARDASVFCGRVIISFTCLVGSVFSCVYEYANDG